MASLGQLADRIQPIFITIDPHRDTADKLRDYLVSFDARIIGLTGTDRAIAAAARSFKVYYAKLPGKGPDDYLMDHSSWIYVIDPQGRFVTVIPSTADDDDLALRLKQLVKD